MLSFALLGGVLWFAGACAAICLRTRLRSTDGQFIPIASRADCAASDLLRVARGLPFSARLRLYLRQSGASWSLAGIANVSAALCLTVLAGIASACSPEWWWTAAPACALAIFLPWLCASRFRKRRLLRFEDQFADALEFASRSLRAGHGLTAAMQMVGDGFTSPLGPEFSRVVDDIRAGRTEEAAVNALAARVPIPDVEFFVAAVVVHLRTGGSLGDVLNNLAAVLRSRYKLRERARRASSHARATGLAISAIPAVAGLLMYFVDPGYLRFLSGDSAGRMMLLAVGLLQGAGYLTVRRMMRVR